MSRSARIEGSRVRGECLAPGDKSISHRVAILASIARGDSRVTGFSGGADCQSTLECIRRLGIETVSGSSGLVIRGRGLFGYQPTFAPAILDAGNSGSTIRMMTGVLAAQRFDSEISGDVSLRRRPMARIVEPLTSMGAQIDAAAEVRPPLRIQGRNLSGISYASTVASAQVKTCVLLAGLHASGITTYSEPALSRNHTELLLRQFGARVERGQSNTWSVDGLAELTPVNYSVPGDLSSAAFLIAAAVVSPDSEVVVKSVGLNPTRSAFLEVLGTLGANIDISNVREQHGERVGDLRAITSALRSAGSGTVISGSLVPNLIDEVPILAVVATQVEGRVRLRDAGELRVKESDRIRTVVDGLRLMGAEITEFEDGFEIAGPKRLTGARIDSAGDHRLAMAFSIAGLIAEGTTEICDAGCAEVSFPGFYKAIASLTEPGTVELM